MGRTKLHRSERKKGSHLPEVMKVAVNLHLSGLSLRKAAKDSNIPYPTLRRYVIKYMKDNSASMEPNYSVNKIFTEEQETSLKEYILDCANKFYGLAIYDVAECVGEAYLKAMTPINITNAFKKCGIFPFNREIFSELDFLPSNVTDRPEPLTVVTRPTKEYDDDATSLSDDSVPNANQDLLESRTSSPSLLSNNFEQNTNEPRNLLSLSLKATSLATMKDLSESENAPPTLKDFYELKNSHMLSQTALVVTPNSKSDSCTPDKSTTTSNVLRPSTSIKMPDSSQPCTGNFVSPKDFRPILKAGPRNNKKGGRKAGESMIATDTPEKNALAEKKNKKSKKIIKIEAVKKVTHNLFKGKENSCKRRKRNVTPVDSSDEEEEEFQPSGLSSGGEMNEITSDSDEDDIVLKDDFPPLKRSPRENDFIIILFKTKNEKIYYVGKILEILDDEEECDFYVSYLKLKSKIQQKFIDPKEPDMAGVNIAEIKYILPFPKIENSNNRRQTTYKFPVDISLLNMRY